MKLLKKLTPEGPLVKPEFRPTLWDLAKPRLVALPRVVKFAGVVCLIGLIALLGLRAKSRLSEGPHYVQKGSMPFNFRYSNGLKPVRSSGQKEVYLTLERRRGPLFLESFSVERLRLPAFSGEVAGVLPSYATGYLDRLKSRYKGFALVEEGRARINTVPGYTVVFQAKLGERTLYGRDVFLPEPLPGSRRGVLIRMLATPAAGVYSAPLVGSLGADKLAYRSFRFGESAPSGL